VEQGGLEMRLERSWETNDHCVSLGQASVYGLGKLDALRAGKAICPRCLAFVMIG
jgi:hypothetical protein